MIIITQSCFTKRSVTQSLPSKSSGLHLLTALGCGVLLSTASLPANASSLISSSDYLDYELPAELQGRCIERDNCPQIEVKYIKTNHDWINNIVNARINHVAANIAQTKSVLIAPPINHNQVKKSLDDFASASFIDPPEGSTWGYSLTIDPEYIGHVQDFELFRIDSYVFTGGAHGMPYSEYLIFDPSSKTQIQLADMLVPAKQARKKSRKKARFKALAYDAYKTWVKTVDEDADGYEKNWPFTLSDNVTLTDKGVDIRYQHYDIGPYAYGMPALSIPYEKLGGIIKPHFIPK